jgi:hypothetical protein
MIPCAILIPKPSTHPAAASPGQPNKAEPASKKNGDARDRGAEAREVRPTKAARPSHAPSL